MSEVRLSAMDLVVETNTDFDVMNLASINTKRVIPCVSHWTTVSEAKIIADTSFGCAEESIEGAKMYMASGIALGAAAFVGFTDMASKEAYTNTGELLVSSGMIGACIMSALMIWKIKGSQVHAFRATEAYKHATRRVNSAIDRLKYYNDPTLNDLIKSGHN